MWLGARTGFFMAENQGRSLKVKFILPALAEATGESWRPIKYSLFPPLGLATLAGYLRADDLATLEDEHVSALHLDDSPDLVAIECYITSARRAYAIADAYRARGIHVVMGGLHPTSLPDEAMAHANTVVAGPAEEAWPRFLEDFRNGNPQRFYRSNTRTLEDLPPIRRDLIDRRLYLIPNSIVVSRGCPHHCDFCYKDPFFEGGKGFYTLGLEKAMADVTRLPGKHLFFLDDNILADPHYARALFKELKKYNRVWQGASTVQSLEDDELLDLAVESGLRSLFVGFESLNSKSLAHCNKRHNLPDQYQRAIKKLHDRGVMINASFVFGFDHDDETVFDSTVRWAVDMGLETATFHLLTPYPGTRLFARMKSENRILTEDWNLYDTRHAVFKHPLMSTSQMEEGYHRAYETFYSWKSILKAAWSKPGILPKLRHIAYTGGWKKMEPIWSLVIKLKRLPIAIPLLERILRGYERTQVQPAPSPAEEV